MLASGSVDGIGEQKDYVYVWCKNRTESRLKRTGGKMKHYLIGRLSKKLGHDEPMLLGRVLAKDFESAAQCVGRKIISPPVKYTGKLQVGTACEGDVFFSTFEECAELSEKLANLPTLDAEMLRKFLQPS